MIRFDQCVDRLFYRWGAKESAVRPLFMQLSEAQYRYQALALLAGDLVQLIADDFPLIPCVY